jgi:hypothetical protein
MIRKKNIRWQLRSVVIGSIVLGAGFTAPQPSFAGSGCHASCKEEKAFKRCNDEANQKTGLNDAERKAEYKKCMSDPYSYK